MMIHLLKTMILNAFLKNYQTKQILHVGYALVRRHAGRKLGGIVMSKEVKDIKIPIKDLLQKSVVKHMVSYEEDEFNLLRKYYIACLNMGFFEPKDLPDMINKFTSKIKASPQIAKCCICWIHILWIIRCCILTENSNMKTQSSTK